MKVAVVGAGASGLPAIKTCLEYGFKVVCFEKTGDIGGLWRYKPQDCDGEASVMKSTVINTSKEITAYSDFPPPKQAANYMHNRQLLAYFRAYAQRFDLQRHIRFHTTVLNVARAADYKMSAKWIVVCKNEQTGEEMEETFDGVMLASGHHVDPYMPTDQFPGIDSFKGKVMHSHSYKDHKGFEDQRVAVIGIGNSSVDAVVELSHVASVVYLVTRRGSWVSKRVWWNGLPLDVWANRFNDILRATFPNLFGAILERELNRTFCHETYGLKPAHKIFQAHPTVNDALPNRILSGTVVVKPNIKRFTETNLVFEDDTVAEDVDSVIFSTGYSFGFPYLEHGKLIEVEENRVALYKYMYKTDIDHPQTLCVLGLIQPLGSIMPISEMQTRVFCDILSGRSPLPSRKEMELDFEQKRIAMGQRYVASRRHTIQVDYLPFLDELADLIGCRPTLAELLSTGDLTLAWRWLFGPPVAYQYRLKGPHQWSGARDALVGTMDRVYAALNTRRSMTPATKENCYGYVLLVIIVLFAIYKLFL